MSKLPSFGNLILSLKVGLISTCVLSAGLVLKHSAPLISDFVASDVPSFWNVILQWLKPPYLYLIVNGIIISIVASSKLQQQKDNNNLSAEVFVGQEKVASGDHVRSGYALVYDDANPTVETKEVLYEREEEKKMSDEMDGGYEAVVVEAPQRSESVELLDLYEKEKPLVSARFGHRKSVKASPEGGRAILKVSKPKRQDTLESTWKTITEGRAIPLTRHLKKSDTWDSHVRHSPPPPPQMKKAETFHEHTTTATNDSNPARLKREPSLGQDELNRRVEAFIKKFNEEMRLQRQISLEQYNEMISRGTG